jgi:hypothetical protein
MLDIKYPATEESSSLLLVVVNIQYHCIILQELDILSIIKKEKQIIKK